jgi:hypothetical protein
MTANVPSALRQDTRRIDMNRDPEVTTIDQTIPDHTIIETMPLREEIELQAARVILEINLLNVVEEEVAVEDPGREIPADRPLG